jgi:translation initiation factor IF-3
LCYKRTLVRFGGGSIAKHFTARERVTKTYRINGMIRARDVRVIGDAGEQLGVMPTVEAMKIARERELDLVEVAPMAEPPVCRFLDYGKFKYEQAKKEREAHKRQATVNLRQVRFRPKTGKHDLAFKLVLVEKLLDQGNKVKVIVLFRGREMSHPQLGKSLLDDIANALGDRALVERPVALEGRSMNMILTPQAKKPKKEKKEKTEKTDEVADAQNKDA